MRIEGRNHWFKFLYQHENGDLTLWGPITKQGQAKTQGQFISCKPEDVRP